MRFLLFVEGETERRALPAFLKRWLDDQLEQPVKVQPVRFRGNAEYLKEVAKRVHVHLTDTEAGDIVAIIGLLDLYGLPREYSGDGQAEQRWSTAKGRVEKDVDEPQFRQYFAVHETEAWLLSSPDVFPPDVRGAVQPLSPKPETVDFDNPPAKRLERIYSQALHRRYNKVEDGSKLFRQLDPRIVQEKCPHFRRMLEELVELARKARV